jgi:hypothetical protein
LQQPFHNPPSWENAMPRRRAARAILAWSLPLALAAMLHPVRPLAAQ